MKKKITDFIVNHCYVVLAVMVGIAGLSAIVSQNVKINHDIMKYMPESSETTQGKNIMDKNLVMLQLRIIQLCLKILMILKKTQ